MKTKKRINKFLLLITGVLFLSSTPLFAKNSEIVQDNYEASTDTFLYKFFVAISDSHFIINIALVLLVFVVIFSIVLHQKRYKEERKKYLSPY
ncbi:MAG: hypothetical protein LBN95_10070 [Prevotellaceae bacterium]|jgi:hypothetical protein|nr:hypothetical protein [Prevotellaceae bacterium]